MRLLLVTDSHGRKMSTVLTVKRPDLIVYNIIVGRVNSTIQAKYDSRLRQVIRFRPDAVICHFGHNDLVHHPCHNAEPEHGKYFFPTVLQFVQRLEANHPMARIIYSSPFPRTVGPGLTAEQKLVYNREAVRFGAMARSSANQEGYECSLNGGLWLKVRKWLENPKYFLPDGLHLNELGQKVVADGWISVLFPDE
jgi:lysophospholipase L1-like esterase